MNKLNLTDKKYSAFLLFLIIWFTNVQIIGPVDSVPVAEIPSFPERIISSMIPHEPISVSNDTELANLASSGTGLFLDPFIIEDLAISTALGHGIHVKNTTSHFIIKNNFIDTNRVEGHFGIFLENVTSGTAILRNNTVQYSMKGIYVVNSSASIIEDNYCYWPYWDNYHEASGIELYDSFNSIIYNNTCLQNKYGIKIIFSDLTVVQSNTCSYNYGPGLMVQDSSDLLIISNIFSFNDDFFYSCAYCPTTLLFGIYLSNVELTDIINNEIISNGYYGILIDADSSFNRVYTNSFIDNFAKWESYCFYVGCDGESYSQAYDDGTTNLWFYEFINQGNYWNEFNELGDYLINGLAETADELPLNENMELIATLDNTTTDTADPSTTTIDDGPMIAEDDASLSFYEILGTFILIAFLLKKKNQK